MIRLFIGTSPNHEDVEAQAVVEWTARKYSSLPIEIHWLKIERSGPLSGWNTSLWATPFTGFRYAIPELCGFEGKAIYCDVDFMFLGDLAELWNQKHPLTSVALARSPKRMCCILWNCSLAGSILPRIEEMKKDGAQSCKRKFWTNNFLSPFEGMWNCLDGEDLPLEKMKAVHFTRMATQPHLTLATQRMAKEGRGHWFDGAARRHPRADLVERFLNELEDAERNGYGIDRFLREPTYGNYSKRLVGEQEAAR